MHRFLRLCQHTRRMLSRAGVAAIACAMLTGFDWPQSALHPAGPAAASIARLWWVMLGGACVVFFIVMVFLGYALLRRGRGPALRRPHMLIVFGGLVLPTGVLIALLVYGVAQSRAITGMDAQVDHIVEVQGRQWAWEFRHRRADGSVSAASIDRLVLPRHRMVEFRIGSSDVIHSFWIPRLGGKVDAIPGRINTLRLRADDDTPMRGQCAEFCGRDHAHMVFAIDVLDAAAFDTWLAAEPTDSTAP